MKKYLISLPIVLIIALVASFLMAPAQPQSFKAADNSETNAVVADSFGIGSGCTNIVTISLKKAGESEPRIISRTCNTVTNIGKNNTMYKLARADSSLSNWTSLQLSTDAGAPAATDLTCPSAITTNGLTMANGTVYYNGIGNFSIVKTWIATGTQSGIAKLCLLNATSNNLMASALISPTVNMDTNDQLTANYTIVAS